MLLLPLGTLKAQVQNLEVTFQEKLDLFLVNI